MARDGYAAVRGSENVLPRDAEPAGDVDTAQRIEITLLLRRAGAHAGLLAANAGLAALALGAQLPQQRLYVTREDFASKQGADPADIAKVEAFARENALTVTATNVAARSMKLSGTLADLQRAFGIESLHAYTSGGRTFRGRTGAVAVPKELDGIVVAVLGFDNRPAARPRRSAPHAQTQATSFTAPRVAQLYDFPTGLDGTGQCIAIIALNDIDANGNVIGSGFAESDLVAYFAMLGIAMPRVSVVGVDGGANMPGPAPGFDQEVTLDIEIAGAVAPGAQLAVYFAPNTTQGFIAAVTAALHDTVHKPSVMSISWGSPEDPPTDPQLVTGLNEALADAALLGVTVTVATGDMGSSDIMPPDGHPHVDAPACSPFALACGGTKLVAGGANIAGETVWNDGVRGNAVGATGGGISNVFARPSYQSSRTMPASPGGNAGRGTPDVAGHAAVSAGYDVFFKGKRIALGGTSAVAPLYAALIALINQRLAALGKPAAGFINPLLYNAPTAFRDIVQGNNDLVGLGVYHAAKGWDPCTGLGSPNGTSIMRSLGG